MKRTEKHIREAAQQARLRYEREVTDARHLRDKAISSAWAAYNLKAAKSYAIYRIDADRLDSFIDQAIRQ